LDIIQGCNIDLKKVDLTDAEFIYNLRSDSDMNRYIHAMPEGYSISSQKEWIMKQLQDEYDYYFIIKNKNGNALGTISIYNIDTEEKTAELGRWISYGNPIQNTESAIMIHDFGFEVLGLETIYTCTMNTNDKVKSFWKRFGAVSGEAINYDGYVCERREVAKERYYNYIKPAFKKILTKYSLGGIDNEKF
jgi:RimJ/RimL family protein N-acetyltransferase